MCAARFEQVPVLVSCSHVRPLVPRGGGEARVLPRGAVDAQSPAGANPNEIVHAAGRASPGEWRPLERARTRTPRAARRTPMPPVAHPRASLCLGQAPAESLNTAFMLHRPEAISMTAMLDEHVTPVGLPLGLTDLEKQMWLAIYSAARKLVALGAS